MPKRRYNIILFLFGFSNGAIGLGVGWYPCGILSIKGSSPNNFLQCTVGFSGWEYGNRIMLGGRFGYSLQSVAVDELKYTHFAGLGVGLYSSDSKIKVFLFEIFYEFELFPSFEKLPISLEIGIGIVGESSGDIFLWLSPGIHFFLK